MTTIDYTLLITALVLSILTYVLFMRVIRQRHQAPKDKLKVGLRPRTSLKSETVSELEYKEIETGHCPDCGGTLCGGPSGGMSMNIACVKCGSEFNYTPVLCRADRNSTVDQPNRERLKSVFDIDL